MGRGCSRTWLGNACCLSASVRQIRPNDQHIRTQPTLGRFRRRWEPPASILHVRDWRASSSSGRSSIALLCYCVTMVIGHFDLRGIKWWLCKSCLGLILHASTKAIKSLTLKVERRRRVTCAQHSIRDSAAIVSANNNTRQRYKLETLGFTDAVSPISAGT